MKIAIVRGPSLNPWEMQNYLPLALDHQLLLVGGKGKPPHFGHNLKIKRLTCLGEIANFFPGGIKLLYRLLGDPQLMLGLEEMISGYDIVQTAEISNYYSYQAIRARQKGLIGKVVVTCWENLTFRPAISPAQKRLKQIIKEQADFFFVPTTGAKEALLTEGVKPEKIALIPMGVNLKKFKIKKEKLKIRSVKAKFKEFRILFVGRLEEEKGIWELLEAFQILKKRYVNLELIIIGQGTQAKKIFNWLIDQKLVNDVSLTREVDYDRIGEEYGQSDIFVLASKPTPIWQEQYGMVLVEAMASGLPIVATRSGAIPEVIGPAGVLVDPGQVDQLAQAIEALIVNEKLRENLSKKGLARTREKYDCGQIAKKMAQLYQKLSLNK